MSLTGRFSVLFLGTLGLVLAAFSGALYLAVGYDLNRQVERRLAAALDVLAAAAEIHPNDVEWEPRERVMPLGEAGDDAIRWLVLNPHGTRVDQSRNYSENEFTATEMSRSADQTVDRLGRRWRVSHRRIVSGSIETGSRAAADRQDPVILDPPVSSFPFLELVALAPIDPVSATLSSLFWLLAAISGTVWLIAAVMCRRLSRSLLRPLQAMVESARGLDASDPGWRLDEAGTHDELDDLGLAFNDLLARLHLAYERQRRFSGDASHQLRTPITVMIGQVEVALRRERSPDEYRRVLKSALGQAVHLGRVVEALLFLGRAEGETSLPDCEILDLDGWLDAHLVAASCPNLHRIIDHEDVKIRAHAPLLGQMLDNLLDNARKYGDPGSPITIATRNDGAFAVLAVENEGTGIRDEDLPHVLEPFYRSADARRLGTPGVGLGLAIVQRIAAAFGGSVVIASQPGKRCRVEVRLPLAADVPQAKIASIA